MIFILMRYFQVSIVISFLFLRTGTVVHGVTFESM